MWTRVLPGRQDTAEPETAPASQDILPELASVSTPLLDCSLYLAKGLKIPYEQSCDQILQLWTYGEA